MDPATAIVMIEIPGGSRNKYELDTETGQIFLDRMLRGGSLPWAGE